MENKKQSNRDKNIYEKYLLQKRLDILNKVFTMINNTQWTYQHGNILDDLLDKFIELSRDLGENKKINLKDLIDKDLIQKSERNKIKK